MSSASFSDRLLRNSVSAFSIILLLQRGTLADRRTRTGRANGRSSSSLSSQSLLSESLLSTSSSSMELVTVSTFLGRVVRHSASSFSIIPPLDDRRTRTNSHEMTNGRSSSSSLSQQSLLSSTSSKDLRYSA